MKNIFVVYVNTNKEGKNFAIAETIKVGENLMAILKRYNSNIVHLCETRQHAEQTAILWNDAYKVNGTYGY